MKSNPVIKQSNGYGISSSKRQSLLVELLQHSNEQARISPKDSPRSTSKFKRSSSLKSPTKSDVKQDKQLYKQAYNAILNQDFDKINEVISLLEAEEKDINQPLKKNSLDEKNLLHLVAESIDQDNLVMKFLIETKNAVIDVEDGLGNTAFLLACRTGKLSTVQYLESKGANIHATNKMGDYCMGFAAYSGNIELVKYLQSLKIEIQRENLNKSTPVDIAYQKGHGDIFFLLSNEKGQVKM